MPVNMIALIRQGFESQVSDDFIGLGRPVNSCALLRRDFVTSKKTERL